MSERYCPFAGALVSYAVVHEDDNNKPPKLITCRWYFSDKCRVARAGLVYPGLTLGEAWFDGNDAVEQLLAFLRGQLALGSVTLSQVEQLYVETRSLGGDTYSGWPEATASTRIEDHGYVPRSPIVKMRQRPYASGRQALVDWIWQGTIPYDVREIPYAGQVLAILPDTRGRVVTADWQGDLLSIETEINVASGDVELQVAVSYSDRTMIIDPPRLDKITEWQLPDDAVTVDVFLVHLDGTLLSHLKVTRGEHYRAHAGQLSMKERAEIELRHGEGDQIEFKPFIEVKDPKESEVLATVVAFSNSAGGRIYVGVSDMGLPIGEVQLRKVGKADAEASLTVVVNRLRELVRERVKPVPHVQIEPITISGEWIVVVDVPPSTSGPHATLQNDIYIRKGASNYKPDPLTELAGLYNRGGDPVEEAARILRQMRPNTPWGSSFR